MDWSQLAQDAGPPLFLCAEVLGFRDTLLQNGPWGIFIGPLPHCRSQPQQPSSGSSDCSHPPNVPVGAIRVHQKLAVFLLFFFFSFWGPAQQLTESSI